MGSNINMINIYSYHEIISKIISRSMYEFSNIIIHLFYLLNDKP